MLFLNNLLFFKGCKNLDTMNASLCCKVDMAKTKLILYDLLRK